jgi:hypothetical protein
VDWGRFNDATVFSVMDATTNEMAYLDRMVETTFGLQLMRLQALHDRFHVGAWIIEANSMGSPQVEALQRAGLPVRPFTTTNATKAVIIEAWALAFERNEVRVLKDATVIAELKSFSSERLPSGLIRYSAPEGMHDDTVMASALAYAGMSHRMRAL